MIPLSSHPIFVKQQPSWGQFWAQTNKTQEQIPNHLGLLFLGVYPMSDIKITKNEDMIWPDIKQLLLLALWHYCSNCLSMHFHDQLRDVRQSWVEVSCDWAQILNWSSFPEINLASKIWPIPIFLDDSRRPMREVVCRSTRNYMELPSARAFGAWWIRISEIGPWLGPWKPMIGPGFQSFPENQRGRDPRQRGRVQASWRWLKPLPPKTGMFFFPEFTTNTLEESWGLFKSFQFSHW